MIGKQLRILPTSNLNASTAAKITVAVSFSMCGKIFPFTQESVTMTRRYIQVDRITDWLEVSTGFAVRPRTIGNQVELEVTPRIASLNS